MTDAPKPQHNLDEIAKTAPRTAAWMRYLAWKRDQQEARRKARLEASPVRLMLLKRAAEKRARRRVRNLANVATTL